MIYILTFTITSKGLKIVLLVVLLVVLGVVAFTTLGGENLLGRMRILPASDENKSEKSVRVPQPKPVEETPASPEPSAPKSSSGGGTYQCPILSLSASSPYGSKTVSFSDILAIYNLSSQDKTTVEGIIFSCDGINHTGSMLFSVYKNGNEKIGDTWTSNCKNDVTINFEPFDISSTDFVELLIKADTTALTTTPNDDLFSFYVSNISGHFLDNEKWTLDKCPNNSVPVYGNVLKY